MKPTKKALEDLKAILQDDTLLNQILAAGAKATSQLDQSGVAFKAESEAEAEDSESDQEAAEEKADGSLEEVKSMFTAMMTKMSAMEQRITGVESQIATAAQQSAEKQKTPLLDERKQELIADMQQNSQKKEISTRQMPGASGLIAALLMSPQERKELGIKD